MLRVFQLKHFLFRVASLLVVASMAGFFLTPDSSTYTLRKTFIKSHAPSASGYLFSISSDDREDSDGDALLDANIPCTLSVAPAHVSLPDIDRLPVAPRMNLTVTHVYLAHRQLLI